MSDLWQGLNAGARERLAQRNYSAGTLSERLSTTGVDAADLAEATGLEEVWIPGVEIFTRKVFAQRHRGFFGELAREEEGVLARIGLWPRQWAAATMFAGTAKGFHIHPPHIPEGAEPEAWFQKLFVEERENFGVRLYDREQWDVMFFLHGGAEMLLVDERAGMARRVMRFMIEGDDRRGPGNVAVVIPPGVAHAIRCEGSRDLVMVYGTTTKFDPRAEGRLAAEVEDAPLPEGWQRQMGGQF